MGEVVAGSEDLLAVGALRLRSTDATRWPAGTRVRALVRAEAVRILTADEPAPPGVTCLAGTLLVKSFRGPVTLLEVDVEGVVFRTEVASEAGDLLESGKALRLAIAPDACRVVDALPASGEARP